jgi:signal transduction histidine kinase
MGERLRIDLVRQAALAFAASAAFFLLAAVAIPLRDHLAVVLAWGAAYLCAVIESGRRWGALYGVPMAIAAGLAFDSFYIPPTREFGADDWQNWLVICIYLALGVLIGLLGALAQRRAEASERSRGALADEQAALRRVATLVARGLPPGDVLSAIAAEAGRLLGADSTTLGRYDAGDTVTGVAVWSESGDAPALAAGAAVSGNNVTARVRRTGRPSRIDGFDGAAGPIAARLREHRTRSSVGAPIVVEGRLWGVLIASTKEPVPLPADTEQRLEQFTELAATAISNTEARAEVAASRARIVAAADEERRRVVRDLHDGAQQRLVQTIVTLKLARRTLERGEDGAEPLLAEALRCAESATEELRELAHGIIPAVLTRGGLRAGVAALATRMPVPVDNDVAVARLPAEIEATAYFVVAEALTNVAKHAHARHATVTASLRDGALEVGVRDDGVGGARADGHGLVGLADRVAALDGRLRVETLSTGGTLVAAAIPLADQPVA